MVLRLFDFLISLICLIIFLPVLILISIVILADSPGGILYRQKRVGRNSTDFTLFKFRTMRVNSDKGLLLTVGSNDRRITRSGYFLRKYKIDELPQLFNVLLGDMSMVGPRPEVRKYVDLYNDEQKAILGVKPGITDYASIQFRNESDILASSSNPEKKYIDEIMPLKIDLNMKYINNMSIGNYFHVIFMTILAIWKRE